MKNIRDLSKSELLNFIYNEISNIEFNQQMECATCGKNNKAKFYYICDKCEMSLASD